VVCFYRLFLVRSESFPNWLFSSYFYYYLCLIFFVWGVIEEIRVVFRINKNLFLSRLACKFSRRVFPEKGSALLRLASAIPREAY